MSCNVVAYVGWLFDQSEFLFGLPTINALIEEEQLWFLCKLMSALNEGREKCAFREFVAK